MKQNNNNNMSDFPEKIGSVDGPETAIIIKRGIWHIEAVLRVQQQRLFIVYLMYVIVVAHTYKHKFRIPVFDF